MPPLSGFLQSCFSGVTLGRVEIYSVTPFTMCLQARVLAQFNFNLLKIKMG